jgi:REP element-mobilizing transposase RayT
MNEKHDDADRKISGSDPEPPPRHLRRLHRVWPDRDGNISYLLTMCVDGRGRVLDNEITFQRLAGFLLDSPQRYGWFGRRFVIMADHIHLIARTGYGADPLGRWIKALKAVVGGLERQERCPPSSPGGPVGPVPSPGLQAGVRSGELARIRRSWRWQDGYHDHKFRTPESGSHKWEYVCLNPVRYGLVKRPENWPLGGEILHDNAGHPPVGPVPPPGGPRLVRGTPPLLKTGVLVGPEPPGEGTRPTG